MQYFITALQQPTSLLTVRVLWLRLPGCRILYWKDKRRNTKDKSRILGRFHIVSLYLFDNPPPTLEPRVPHSREPKKYPVGPFFVALRRASATSAKLKYTMLSPKQGGEGGGGSIKGKFFSLHFWMNWSIWSTFSNFSKFLSKTCRICRIFYKKYTFNFWNLP